MSKSLYARQWTETVVSGHSLKVYSDKVPNGYVLKVNACFFHVPESAAGDLLTISLENGGQDIIMRSRARATTLDGMSIFNSFPMGEGDRLYGYAKDAEATETLTLNIVGELIPIKEWREYQE